MIVIVAGLPGSGKSFFAEHLAKRMDAVYICSDRVRIALRARGKYSLKDKLIVYKEMWNQTINAIDHERDVVVDATFYHHTMREMFLRLGESYNVTVRVIEVIADEELIRQRLQAPRKYSEADFSVYESVRDTFEGIEMPHLTLESTNDNLDEMLKQAEQYLEDDGQ